MASDKRSITTSPQPDPMTDNSLIRDPEPLQSNYIPPEFVDRKAEKTELETFFSEIPETSPHNLVVAGPRGSGKTHLLLKHHRKVSDKFTTCYIPCQKYDTQYQVLQQVAATVTDQPVETGHHTGTLKERIEEHTDLIDVLIILDEIDFLLLNDGDDLLYYLSRTNQLNTILTHTHQTELKEQLDQRTLSSLQPHQIEFPSYQTNEIYQILVQRARKSLQPKSVKEEALTQISETTSNATQALNWLKTTAQKTDDRIDLEAVAEHESQAFQEYTENLLQPFSQHHHLTYQAIQELTDEKQETSIQTGDIYKRYQELCKAYSTETLTNRRISDFLKHLELLNLIQAEYHYGGSKGKTREITTRF